ncbi:MAG: nitrilase-related carbon-nitrogen hydrolase [Moraxellaceae bacterium]
MSLPVVAALQMVSGPEVAANLAEADRLLALAAAGGAQLAVLPENFAVFDSTRYRAVAATRPALLDWLAAAARRHRLWLVAGTLPAATRPDGSPVPGGRVRSACHVLADDGRVVARYDKLHLFDVDVADGVGQYRESASFEPGETPVCVDTPVGRLGLSICYDLRFPELYRTLAADGATLFAVPAAFTAVTGEAHWQVLLRARAIENQCLVIGAGQGGAHGGSRHTHGHSQIVDAWGTVLALRAEAGPGVVLAPVDAPARAALAARMPVQKHRRLR